MKTFDKLLLFVLFLAVASASYAQDLEIVDVKRNIPLAESEPVYKDFYIKLNGPSGLKKNLVVKATRKIIVKDSSLKPVGDFTTVVGLLKIIQISDSIAVAREFKLTSRQDEPMIEQIGIMVGDTVDLSGSFTDVSKRQAASAPPITPSVEEKKPELPSEKTALAPAPTDI